MKEKTYMVVGILVLAAIGGLIGLGGTLLIGPWSIIPTIVLSVAVGYFGAMGLVWLGRQLGIINW